MPTNAPLLVLDNKTGLASDSPGVRQNLSAVVRHGRNLFLACDEGTFVERLTLTAPDTYERHQRLDLAPLLALPFKEPKDNEIDIEGLDVAGGYLWLTGSHSLKRKKPKEEGEFAKDIERLTKVEADGNRFTLARVPLIENKDGDFALASSSGKLRAGRLEGDEHGNVLVDAWCVDEHIGPFAPRPVKIAGKKRITGIPSKENGLDIEGLAVTGSRIFLGMRGPVLRGWAIVLELQVSSSSADPLELKEMNGRLYRKHFLELDGLGVRELAVEGENLLILAGPTMDLDGPVAVYRWPGALASKKDTITSRNGLQRVLDVPYGVKSDHAEGMMVVSASGAAPTEACIVFDSPAKKRLKGDFGVRAGVFTLASSDLG